MHFSSETEATLALVSMVLSADQVGTPSERKFLFERVGKSEPFKDVDPGHFNQMITRVNDQLFSQADAGAELMHPEHVKEFCHAVKAALPRERMGAAFQMACEMACTDGLVTAERSLLDALGSGLGMTQDDVSHILMKVEASGG